MFHVSALFHGFPLLAEPFEPIMISTTGRLNTANLTMEVGWFLEERDPEGNRRLSARPRAMFEDTGSIPALVVNTAGRRRIHRLDDLPRYGRVVRVPTRETGERMRLPAIWLSPYSGESTHTLGSLWDDIALTDDESDVIEALRIIDPRISAITMVGGEARSRGRTARVRADNLLRPVPLRSFGDGVNRLFAMALSLVNARGGILLVDEFENGLHYMPFRRICLAHDISACSES